MAIQLYYFGFTAPEKIPLAIKRYQDEIIRVCTVLEDVLGKLKEEGKEWLVGGKLTVADLGFIMCVPKIRVPVYAITIEHCSSGGITSLLS